MRLATRFGLLVLVQAAHSMEEYVTRLYDVLAPARAVASLVSSDLALGFAVANGALVAFGLWCWALPVRRGGGSGRAVAWGWGIVEIANGIGHLAFAMAAGGYFPGAATAPLLLAGGAWLVKGLRDEYLQQPGLVGRR